MFFKKKYNLICLLCLLVQTGFAQVPKLGLDSTLDIACWNINWFGDTQYGPSNEVLQFNNVSNVLKNTDFDIISLEEVSDATAWSNLQNQLPNYGAAISTYSATQKTALLFKKDFFELIDSKPILTETQFNYNFASRPPLFVTLRYTKLHHDTLYCIVLHMKAQSESDQAGQQLSYNRRKGAGDALRNWLASNLSGKKYVVLGDWNDDLYTSIFNSQVSPYKSYLDNNYFFATRLLTDQAKHTTNSGSAVIDHQLVSDSMRIFYIDSTVRVFDQVKSYISSYATTTSDHFPVFSRYRFFDLPKKPVDTGSTDTTSHSSIVETNALPSILIYPNPILQNHILNFHTSEKIESIQILDLLGNIYMPKYSTNTITLDGLSVGMYIVRIQTRKCTYDHRIEIIE